MPEFASIYGKAIDTSFNIVENGVYNSWAAEREREARKENYYYNEAAASEADRRTRKLYEDYMTPQARLRMYQEAGLSPSLMFGDGAAAPQPTQGAQGSGASGINPNVFGSLSGATFADSMLKLAEARKANVEADVKEGNNDFGRSLIAKQWAEAGATEAAKCLYEAEETAQNWQNYITENTVSDVINKIKDDSMKAFAEAQEADLKWKFDQASFESRLNEISMNLALMHAEKVLKENQVKLTRAEVKRLAAEIFIQAQDADTHAKNAQTYKEYVRTMQTYYPEHLKNERWHIAADAFGDLCKTAAQFAGASQFEGETNTTTEMTEYDRQGNAGRRTVTNTKSGKTGNRQFQGHRRFGFGGKW